MQDFHTTIYHQSPLMTEAITTALLLMMVVPIPLIKPCYVSLVFGSTELVSLPLEAAGRNVKAR